GPDGQGGSSLVSPVEQTFQSLDRSGSLQRTVSKVYGNALTPPQTETVTLQNGLVSQVQNCLAAMGQFIYISQCIDNSTNPPNVGGFPLIGSFLGGGLLIDRYEYDYGPGAPGALLRHTHNDYTLFKNP